MPRELDYETDLLARLNWADFDVQPTIDRIPETPLNSGGQYQRIDLGAEGISAQDADQSIETGETWPLIPPIPPA